MRYLLRELSRCDLAEMTTWRNDPELMNQLGSVFRYIDHEVDINWFNAYLASRTNNVRLAVCKIESGKIIGAVHLLQIDWTNRSAEFGICIADRECQGNGAGAFATTGILKHAFMDLNLHRVHLSVLANNERAIRFYEKTGFSVEGCSRQAVFKSGEYVDMIQMSILSQEYRHSVAQERV